MTKQDAIAIFGGVGKLAEALGITSQAVSLWPAGKLSQRRQNEVTGAAVRAGKQLPAAEVKGQAA
jgi:hypothetical protein